MEKKDRGQYLGGSRSAFDAGGDCVGLLPWHDEAAFVNAVAEAEFVPWEAFSSAFSMPDTVAEAIKGHDVLTLRTADDVYLIHDFDADEHHVFVDAPRITLFRCESNGCSGRRPAFNPDDWKHQGMAASGQWEAMGRWFVADPALLDFYAEDVGEEFRIVKVEVDALRSEGWKVTDSDARRFSRDPENEYFLPREWAEAAESDEAMRRQVLERVRAARSPTPG